MKLIVGLGNPGACYTFTRHNVGFRVVELLGRRGRVLLNRYLHQAQYGQGRLGPEEVVLAKPLTYMNLSGRAVAPLLQHFGLGPEDLLVIYDDIALPLGRLRLRPRGSAGGHRGMQHVITSLGTDQFPRLRIGIGSPPPGMVMADYVLSEFTPAEEEKVTTAIALAARAVELYLAEGLVAAMNRVNSPACGESD